MRSEEKSVLLSIVVPTLDAASHLPACFAAIAEGQRLARDCGVIAPDIELIVADGGSADDTVALAGQWGARVIAAPRGRGSQLAAGADVANGDWLLFLHADTRLADNWLCAVSGHINNPANPGMAAAFRFVLDDPSRAARFLESAVAWRTRALALPYGDQGLLVSRNFYRALGGFGKDPLMEDVDIVCRIGAARLRRLDAAAITSAARYREGKAGWILRPLRNLSCLSLWFLGLPAPMIARLYGR
ncbi:MAG: hypothetical protein RL477_794 [Pseudomonadota bacterium]|jgi:rSAM/selenodomain-associated transferase 2